MRVPMEIGGEPIISSSANYLNLYFLGERNDSNADILDESLGVKISFKGFRQYTFGFPDNENLISSILQAGY